MNRLFTQSLNIVLTGILLQAVTALGAPAAAAELAYVGNQASGNISVIDTSRDEVVRTVPASGKIGSKIQAVIADPSRGHLFAVDAEGNALIEVDARSGRVIKRIPVGAGPEGASLSPSGETIAVCVEQVNQVVLVDVATAAITRVIHTQGLNPEHCVFSGDGRWLMTSNENSDDVDIIDLRTDRSVARAHTSGHPRGIAWLPQRMIAYVAQERANAVDVIDAAKHAVIGSIHTGLRPADAIASRDGKMVFVSNGGDGTIAAIDTANRKVIATIPVGKRPWNMAMTRDGKKLYVANGRSNSVSVIDTDKLTVIKNITVGGLPWGVSIR